MDVSNLVPTQDGARSTAGAAARGKPEAAEAPAKAMAAAATGGPVTPRPTVPTSSVSDRVERSEELARRIAELKIELRLRVGREARGVPWIRAGRRALLDRGDRHVGAPKGNDGAAAPDGERAVRRGSSPERSSGSPAFPAKPFLTPLFSSSVPRGAPKKSLRKRARARQR